ncbi:HD domain-containing protein [Acanthopleuribacter pedis]|uniref:HD domain-containing protein n=1 Tax=Acanthopleuribacter pedis TaxID=442870 RepID=A0A8J7QAJ5_9BACT|nr:HD domain-containing protein [Acanthopleuribacter pedis]MBO1320089.1 HD domain-containing protein [Acanthopleuribacter pedis]
MAADALTTIPEFSATGGIRLAPGQSSIPVTKRLLKVIDSYPVQRLRRIRQLSLADRVYPSATHTRFAHALGVYGNILAYLRQLHRFPEFADQYDEKDYLAIMLAGLLHDLGHYPCSHQLDHLDEFPEHELLTVGLLKGDLVLKGENLAELIWSEFQLEPDRIAALLGPAAELEPRLKLLKQIIDSPLDADKCDYLIRDSFFCGIEQSSGFDRERFITNLVPSYERPVLCVHEKGLVSAERFQLSRYWMYRSVYWSHTVRSFITMLSSACRYFQPGSIEPGEAWNRQLLGYNDHNFMEWLHERVSAPGRELIEMAYLRRRPYKRVYTVAFNHEPRTYDRLQQKKRRRPVTDWFIQWAARKGVTLEDHHLIWDVPPIYKTSSWETFPIKLANGIERPIHQESPVIEALGPAFQQGVRKIRLFCHPRLSELLEAYPQERPHLQEFLT